MSDAATAYAARVRGVVLARLQGPKARKHTRHWTPAASSTDLTGVAGKTGHPDGLEIKALDPEYIVPDSLITESVESLRAAAEQVARESATDAADRVAGMIDGPDGESIVGGDSGDGGMFEIDTDLLADLIAEALEDMTAAADRHADRIRDAIEQGEAGGADLDELLEGVEQAEQRSAAALARDARTTATALAGKAVLDQARALGVTHVQWISRRDERVRAAHRRADGQVRALGDMFDVGGFMLEYPGDPSGLPATASQVHNCFVGETDVNAPDLEGAYRVPYRGELVTVHFASGRVLSGTPNHPVLTDRGWVALGQLHQLHHAVCTEGSDQLVARADPHPHRRPAPIAQIYDALAQTGARRRVSGAVVNFHGDRAAGQVDVVTADRVLDLRFDGAGHEKVPEDVLKGGRVDVATTTDGGRPLAHFALGADPAASGVVSGLDECDSSLRAEIVHAQLVRRSAAPWLHAGAQQAGSDGGPVDPAAFGERLLGFTGDVALDQVVRVERDPQWSGHVYDLQTSGGTYTAAGVIVHNCRCGLLLADVDAAFFSALDEIADALADPDVADGVDELFDAARASRIYRESDGLREATGFDGGVNLTPAPADVVGWRTLAEPLDAVPGQTVDVPADTVFALAPPETPNAATLAVRVPRGTLVGVADGAMTLPDGARVTVLADGGAGVQLALF